MNTRLHSGMSVRLLCFGILLTAVVFRLAAEPMLRRSVGQAAAQLAGRTVSLQGQPLVGDKPADHTLALTQAPEEPEEPEEAYPVLLYTPPEKPAVSAVFCGADAQLVSVRNRAGVEYDGEELICRPLEFDMTAEGPLVLIVHTHATEAYTPEEGAAYEDMGNYRTKDTDYNVVRVGQALADTLNAHGIETLHARELNDLPSYDDSYLRAAEVIQTYLEEYPSIQMVIDVHRDAVENSTGEQLAMTTELGGEPYAQLMLVMGTNASALEHPDWEQNLSCALKIQAYCEQRDGGLFRTMSLRAQRYNEHLTPCSILLEVGTAGNTLSEALRSAERFGAHLAQLLSEEQPA